MLYTYRHPAFHFFRVSVKYECNTKNIIVRNFISFFFSFFINVAFVSTKYFTQLDYIAQSVGDGRTRYSYLHIECVKFSVDAHGLTEFFHEINKYFTVFCPS